MSQDNTPSKTNPERANSQSAMSARQASEASRVHHDCPDSVRCGTRRFTDE